MLFVDINGFCGYASFSLKLLKFRILFNKVIAYLLVSFSQGLLFWKIISVLVNLYFL
jgi:hypothetical protein